jgi:hypothetical protein
VVVAVVAGAVAASTRSSDERALQPTRAAASQSIERKVDPARSTRSASA